MAFGGLGALVRGGRDLRVDAARGLALWFIFIDHVPGNLLGRFTLRNVAFCDATEAFVLLAGYAAGLAYGRVMDRAGWHLAAARVLARAGALYVAHIFLFVLFVAQVGYSAAALDSAVYLDEMLLDPLAAQPYRALLEALLLRYQPSFLNILPLYIVLLGLMAAALPLLRRPWALLALSGAVYGLARATGFGPTSWLGGGWYFNPLAWQLLFAVGAALGYRPPGGEPRGVPWRRWLGALCALVLLLGAASVLVLFGWPELLEGTPAAVPAVLWNVDKAGLHPFRLLSMLSLFYLVAHGVPAGARWLRGSVASAFALLGQHGLPVFCAGIFLSFLGRLALELGDGWAMQLAVNLLGLAALLAVAALRSWYDAAGGRGATPRLPAPAAADTNS